ncbi:MAG: succinylglutamate desuccinylase/aspartoacylase family protein [Saprospiraceae bacterium]
MEQSYKITILDSEIIEPGEKKLIKLPVGYLPSGNKIYIHIFVNKSLLPGPTILLIGGIHGDEINGTEIVRRASEWVKSRNILKGTVITIPLLNVYGFIHFTREVAEGKDVNRSFPGSSRGSLASRIANILYKSILPGIDALIDFHTGGGQRYNYPQVRFTKNDKKSFALAKAFGAPFLIESTIRQNSLRQYAHKLKIANLTFEGGEASRFDGFSIDKALMGIKNVLHDLGMIEEIILPPHKTVIITEDKWIRAPYSGIFVWNRASGVYVSKGEILGTISDPDNLRLQYVKAKESGYLIGHNNAPVVHVGDALFHMGQP